MKNDQSLREAVVDGYRSIGELKILVKDELDVRLQDVVNIQQPNPAVVSDLLEWSESEGRLGELALAAYERKPGNPKLRALFGTTLSPYGDRRLGRADWARLSAESGGGLERIVLDGVRFEDALPWVARLGRIFRVVCRVEPQPITEGKLGYATGFLVADDVIMTNCHVAEGFAANGPGAVRVRFDYSTDEGGVATQAGRAVALANTWDLLRSPVDQLDFALIRLAEPVGAEVLHGAARGVVRLREHAFRSAEPLVIVQHPDADPLKLALGSVTDPNPEANRVGYNVNTLPGSSGSPCFTSALEAVAIHRYGGGSENRGVRLGAIRAFLGAADQRAKLVAAGIAAILD